MTNKLDQLETTLAAANRIILATAPLIGIVTTTGAFLLALARHTKMSAADVQAYAEALTAFQADRAGLAAALDAFHAKYPAEKPELPPVDPRIAEDR